MSDSGKWPSNGSPEDGSGSTEPTISFEKNTPTGSGPVYGAPDPKYTTPNHGTPNTPGAGAGDQGQQFGPPPGTGYPPPSEGSGQYGAPPHYADGQYGAPQYGGPQYGAPQYGGPPYAGGPGYMDPMAPYGRHPVTGEPFSDKQKLTAGLLGILLGAFGAGRFYLNQPGIAVAQIAVTWLTCGIGGIWPLIDGILMLTGSVRDQHGRPLRD
ncbi:TM2 domain-containing protein [Rhodococcus sp. IEGM 1401]|uniref:TM2 domain-containing protein n=1 Tax=Rhodococcus cercidiphylli TaxID=489916 RepID=A0ABU4AZE3_9NOCA|nr:MULTISPECIES: TM2 domain-containing protein [Rhodococcus]MCZ4560070.1 TM2 domain-containing protein [Rhodococcus sp. IEGM 1401]MDI9919886.1 TM2 domain-containing protein [Rhodococcus sp. IEGM 1372]MDI9926554.1 TM2 domain-containing protein [Rhodococcus sp. IEGM 1341]MDV6231571.1 TM2 domain-containing protein [Rhodococcus cercidiphylli]MDV8032651.1 TM2 domain-containing protein [Rhodococcus sp. IEGM 1414]